MSGGRRARRDWNDPIDAQTAGRDGVEPGAAGADAAEGIGAQTIERDQHDA